MNKRRPLIITALVITLAALAVGGVMAADPLSIDWWVIGGGGGQTSAGDYTVSATVGQAVTGMTSTDPYELCSGFWCRMQGVWIYNIHLPIILHSP